jgi:hypothetical protein
MHHFWSSVQKIERGQRLEDRRGQIRPQTSMADLWNASQWLRSLIVLSNVRGGKNPAKPATARGRFSNMRQN